MILLQRLYGYSSQSNGAAERMNRTIRDMMRTILIDKPNLGQFWDYAAKYCGHIYNMRKIVTFNGKTMTAFEALTGKKPKAMLEWGSDVYIHINTKLGNKKSTNKNDPKAKRAIYLGHMDNMSAAHVLVPSPWRIIRHDDFRAYPGPSTLWTTLSKELSTPATFYTDTDLLVCDFPSDLPGALENFDEIEECFVSTPADESDAFPESVSLQSPKDRDELTGGNPSKPTLDQENGNSCNTDLSTVLNQPLKQGEKDVDTTVSNSHRLSEVDETSRPIGKTAKPVVKDVEKIKRNVATTLLDLNQKGEQAQLYSDKSDEELFLELTNHTNLLEEEQQSTPSSNAKEVEVPYEDQQNSVNQPIRQSKRIRKPTEAQSDWMETGKRVPNRDIYQQGDKTLCHIKLVDEFDPEQSVYTISHLEKMVDGETKVDPRKFVPPEGEITLAWTEIKLSDKDKTKTLPLQRATVPDHEHQAIRARDSDDWKDSMRKELRDQLTTKALIPVEATFDIKTKQVISARWVYTLKRDINYDPISRKARMPLRGNTQEEGSYDETSSPVLMRTTVPFMLAVACQHNWTIKQIDISHAYLNADIDTEIYIRPSRTFKEMFFVHSEKDYYLRVNKAVYGLKQSGYLWYICFSTFLENELGFVASVRDPCIFYKYDIDKSVHPLVILLYVDDCLIIHKDEEITKEYKQLIFNKFPGKETPNGVGTYLGININQRIDLGTIEIDQQHKIKELISQFKDNENFAKIPLSADEARKFKHNDGDTTPLPKGNDYLSIVGKLQWITGTRPDIAYATSLLAQQCSNPTKQSWSLAMRVVNYLAATQNYKLKFNKKSHKQRQLVAYADASYKQLSESGSVSGMLLTYGGNAFCWKVQKQKHINNSTKDAEMSASFTTTKYVAHFRTLLKEMVLMAGGVDLNNDYTDPALPTIIHQDNTAVIATFEGKSNIKYKETNSGLIDGYARYIEQQVNYGVVEFKYIKTKEQRADIFTKPLSVLDHERFIPLLSLVPIPLTDDQKLDIRKASKVTLAGKENPYRAYTKQEEC